MMIKYVHQLKPHKQQKKPHSIQITILNHFFQ